METRRVSRVHRVRPADIPGGTHGGPWPVGHRGSSQIFVGSQGVVDAGACSRFYRQSSGGHSASRSSPCGRVAGRRSAQPATIADRTTRTPASRGDSRSGSWSRPDGRSGWTSWRPPSSARSRPSSGTRGCELRNLQWLVPNGGPCVFPRYFARVSNPLANYQPFSVNRSSWYCMAIPCPSQPVWPQQVSSGP